MNPDGNEVVKEGECFPGENVIGRLNANLKDLFQNFPDFRKREEISEITQPETLNVMKWMKEENSFHLSATFFAGEIVTMYPLFAVPLHVE